MLKPIIIDLPYPQLNGIEKDYKTAIKILPAYAGGHSELNAILQYTYHFFNFNGQENQEMANTLMGIAMAEMKHLSILGELLYKLGLDPGFREFSAFTQDFFKAKSVSYSKMPIKMLLDDIAGEMLAVKEYNDISNSISSEQVSSVICRIILDEELHIKVLKDLLNKLDNKKENSRF